MEKLPEFSRKFGDFLEEDSPCSEGGMVLPNEEQLPQLTREGVEKCFGCGQRNPVGLKLRFYCDREKATAQFVPGEWHQGWPGIVHGGIIYALLDEVMGYAVFPLGINCLTARSEVTFKHPAPLGKTLHLTGTITKKTRKLIQTAATITLEDGTIVAEGTALMYVINQKRESRWGQGSLPLTKVKAVIWDMDGVIADTAPFHFESWKEVFRREGKQFTEAEFQYTFGLRNEDIIRKALGTEVSAHQMESIAKEKEALFRHKIGQKARPSPGVIALMKSLQEGEVKQAIASSAPVENILLLMKALEIDKLVEEIISEKDVTQGKPHPQAFLLAAHRLGVAPKNCLVIEDAIAGVRAAKTAEMKCIAVTTTHPPESLKEADLIVASLAQVDVATIERLLSGSPTLP